MNKFTIGDFVAWRRDKFCLISISSDIYFIVNAYNNGHYDFFTLLNCRTKEFFPYLISNANIYFVNCENV